MNYLFDKDGYFVSKIVNEHSSAIKAKPTPSAGQVARINESKDGWDYVLESDKIAEENKALELQRLKADRDLALASNKVEIREGEFVNARYEDKPNLEAIYSALPDGASYEFYNGGNFVTLTRADIATVLQQGQIQSEAIWSQFKADVKAL